MVLSKIISQFESIIPILLYKCNFFERKNSFLIWLFWYKQEINFQFVNFLNLIKN